MSPPQPLRTDDLIQPFQIETMLAEGRLVRLGAAIDAILCAHDYPAPVAVMLGECLTLAALLSDGIEYDGVLTLQLKGDGPITMLVADVTSDGGMRGYAQFTADSVDAALADAGGLSGAARPVPLLLGDGHLAFTVDQGSDTRRYQGLVTLDGATIAECAHNYLRQSVQLDAAVKLAIGKSGKSGKSGKTGKTGKTGAAGRETWRAGGLMVQRKPGKDRPQLSGAAKVADPDDAWRRAVVLMASCTDAELLDAALHPHRLLYRLFSQDGVRVFEPVALGMQCRCSLERVRRVLRSFPQSEIETMKVDGRVVVTCEFCNAAYEFDDPTLETLYVT